MWVTAVSGPLELAAKGPPLGALARERGGIGVAKAGLFQTGKPFGGSLFEEGRQI